jgi:hypothetical protein
MPYETFWEPRGIRWVFEGSVTDDDLTRPNEDLYDDSRFLEIRYQIADFRFISGVSALSETVRLVSHMDREQSRRNPDVKVAILGTSPVVKGLARMYALTGAEDRWQVRLFETEEEAREWIGD